jgi:hypothetical protein
LEGGGLKGGRQPLPGRCVDPSPMFRSQPRTTPIQPERDKVIFIGGVISALFAVVLLLLAYSPA